MQKLWRNSASLIVLVKSNSKTPSNNFNYKVITFKRSDNTNYASTVVFPGGIVSRIDESQEWLDHFKKFNVTEKHLQMLTNVAGKRPPIFETPSGCLARELSLRITAIREMFEELGVLICCKKDNFKPEASSHATFVEDFNREKWQKAVHSDPKQFLTLCQELDVVPDLWNLYEWNVWLSPAHFERRYQTAFFLVALQNVPQITPEKTEVDEYSVEGPHELLKSFAERKIVIFPPQIYELGRLTNIKHLEELMEFTKKRQPLGITVFMPVIYDCCDGTLYVLPGDDLYPDNPDYVAHFNTAEPFEETLEQLRNKTKNLNRTEFSRKGRYFYCNVQVNGHLTPKSSRQPKHRL